jgi:hypothetical protein
MQDEQLRQKINSQLNRLLRQLHDLEESREELDEEEYQETRVETLKQMQEFEHALNNMTQGNLSLEDEFGHMKIAMRAAVSQAFKTPEIISSFAKKQPDNLRKSLSDYERDLHLGKLSKDDFALKKVETLLALEKLKQELSPDEKQFLTEFGTKQVQILDNNSSDHRIRENVLHKIH